ncbi:MAG: TolC family protein [bacterium]
MQWSIHRNATVIVIVSLFALTSRAAADELPPPPSARPLGRDLPAALKGGLESGSEPTGSLSLQDVLVLAVARNPELAVFSWHERAADAQIIGAGLRPNPELSLEVEDVGGTGESQGFKAAQFTLGLGQMIELGGKRGARLAAARRLRDLAAWDYEAKRLEILTRTAAAFIEVLAAQERIALAEEAVRLAEQIETTVDARVNAARSHEAEGSRARIALASARIERDLRQRKLLVARQHLASHWGSTDPRYERVDGDLSRVSILPPYERLSVRLEQHPNLARWATEATAREAFLRAETAGGRPDLTLGAGVRHRADVDENAAVLSVAMPLPLFNRNQGAIAAAKAALARTEDECGAARSSAHAALRSAYQSYEAARSEIALVEADVLPDAEEAFQAIRGGYEEGRFSFLEVLDVQHTLAAARAQRLRALAELHLSVVDIEALIGESIEDAGR